MNTLQIQVPDEFPRVGPLSSLSGTHSKFVARKINDRFVMGWTPEELRERYANCEDLVQQLVEFATKKSSENPDWTHAFIFDRTSEAVAQKGQSREWDLMPEEHAWVMARVKLLLTW